MESSAQYTSNHLYIEGASVHVYTQKKLHQASFNFLTSTKFLQKKLVLDEAYYMANGSESHLLALRCPFYLKIVWLLEGVVTCQ